MSALAARAMGYRVVVLEPKSPCACTSVADLQIESGYDDPEGLRQLFAVADVVTFEFENVRKEPLEGFVTEKPIRPSPGILSIAQNREREKTFLRENGFPVAPFRVIACDADVGKVLREDFPFPAILKTADFGYDGKGQIAVDRPEELADAWETFQGARAVLEEKISFRSEYSIIVVRRPSGEMVTYPLCRNIHRHHILDVTFSPAYDVGVNSSGADALCRKLAEAMGLEGILVIELFLTRDEEWIINEMAPRPHNSGHFSLDGSVTSQFENHIRAVCDQPLGDTSAHGPSAMQNLLGETLRAMGPGLATAVLSVEGSHLHLYDKGDPANGRKMGHINVSAADEAALRRKVDSLREILSLPRIS